MRRNLKYAAGIGKEMDKESGEKLPGLNLALNRICESLYVGFVMWHSTAKNTPVVCMRARGEKKRPSFSQGI